MPTLSEEIAWNARMIADFRAHGGEITEGPLAGSRLLLLTSVGARSGAERTNPLGYTRDGGGYVIVGSNSGSDVSPSWFANLRRNPEVTIEVGTERFPAHATITEGAERRRLLDAHIATIPIFGRYESMTSRELPVIVFERAAPERPV